MELKIRKKVLFGNIVEKHNINCGMYSLDKNQINVNQTIPFLSFSIAPNVWIIEWKLCHTKLLNDIFGVRNRAGHYRCIHASECY